MNIQVNDLLSLLRAELAWRAQSEDGIPVLSVPSSGERSPIRPYGSFTFTKDPTDFNDPKTYPKPTQVHDVARRYLVLDPESHLRPVLSGQLGVEPQGHDQSWFALRPRDRDLEHRCGESDPARHPARSTGNNISPRAGFAYDLQGNGRSVVRGGIGPLLRQG